MVVTFLFSIILFNSLILLKLVFNSKLFETNSDPRYKSERLSKAVLVCPNTINFTPFLTAFFILRYNIGKLSLMSSAHITIASELSRSSNTAFSYSSPKYPLNM